ncbi:MAG TPA: hypothetical protein VG895_01915 [Patescibacteria group bacterium]|nr:hypothetical protein [Patescibacteria group bacterium]
MHYHNKILALPLKARIVNKAVEVVIAVPVETIAVEVVHRVLIVDAIVQIEKAI